MQIGNTKLATATAGTADPARSYPGTGKDMKRLWIELTKRCNLRCMHCFVIQKSVAHDSASSEIDLTFISHVLAEAKGLGGESIELTGGEPLLRKDFRGIYLHAHETGMAVSVTTNGTLISDDLANLWESHRPRQIKISFYGWDQPSYELVVGKRDAYRLFIAGLTRLAARAIPFSMLIPAHPALLPNNDKIRVLGAHFGAVGKVSVGWELMLHSRHDAEANKCIKAIRLSPVEAARQKMQFPELVYADIRLIRKAETSRDTLDTRLFTCAAGDQTLAIDSEGNLHPCRPLFNPSLAFDLKQGTLRQALEEHMPRVRAMKIRSLVALERCGRCKLRPACLSCPATAWMENASLDTPVEYHCKLIHQEAYWLGILNPEQKGWERPASDCHLSCAADVHSAG